MLGKDETLSALAYLALTFPLVGWAFASKRPLGKNTLALALAGVFLSLAVKLAWDQHAAAAGAQGGGNYYQTLEVSRHSSAFEVRKSYKQISRVLHPDKNPSPDAEAQFQRVKVAYDVLMDEKFRDLYNRFGLTGQALTFDPRLDELRLITDIAGVYVFWLVVLFATTFSQGARASRTWGCIAGVALLVLQFSFSATEFAIPTWLPGATYLTEAELVALCHRVFPGILVALRCVSESFWVDLDETSVVFLREMSQQMNSVQKMLVQLKRAAAGGGGASKQAVAADEVGSVVDALSSALEESDVRCQKMIDRLKNSNSDPAANYYWLVLVAVYGIIYLSGAEEGGGGAGGEGAAKGGGKGQ